MSSSATTRVGERVTVSMAVVKVKVGDETLISAGEGNGPVNALDVALRKDLGKYQGYIKGLELTDYRVRILNGGTEAVTRVLIESQDETGERWTTVGVSPNIIDASFQALMDSIVYKLVKSGAPALNAIQAVASRIRSATAGAISFSRFGNAAAASNSFGRMSSTRSTTSRSIVSPARMNSSCAHVIEQHAERIPETVDIDRSGSASCGGRAAPR